MQRNVIGPRGGGRGCEAGADRTGQPVYCTYIHGRRCDLRLNFLDNLILGSKGIGSTLRDPVSPVALGRTR